MIQLKAMVAIVPPSLLVLLMFFALPPVVHSVPRGGSISENSDIFCAGWNNHGPLADGTTEDRLEPVQVLSAGVENRQVSAGAQFTLVLQNDGVVCLGCWPQQQRAAR